MSVEDDTTHIERLTRFVETLAGEGSDAMAGAGAILREIETHRPGFIQRLAAAQRLKATDVKRRPLQ